MAPRMHCLTTMKRTAFFLTSTIALGLLGLLHERDAAACGGCFTPPPPPQQTASDITDERMLLSVSTKQSTLYDQIRYSGNPSSFAWVLPIHGTVDVGLSAEVMFDSFDTLTKTTIYPPPQNCPPAPTNCGGGGGFAAGAATDAPSADAGSVTVTKAQNVGPYATVQLHPNSTTDASALEDWLTQNGFEIPEATKPTINEYVSEGFDFLAMKLLPGEGVSSMRPVRVTAPGSNLSLPLRMAAIGTGATVGITIWVVADGRYEPQNFPSFRIEDKDLVWDFATSSSNYTTLRTQNAATLGGKGWEMESSLDLAQAQITGLVTSGGTGYGGAASQADQDYLPVPADGQNPGKTAEQVRTEDIAALFAGMSGPSVRVTRMRSDISHEAMTTDFVLRASSDQSELPNVRTVTKSANLQCPVYDGCNVVGYAPAEDANAAQNGSHESFACTTAPQSPASHHADWAAAAAGLAFVGASAIRARRRR